MRGTTEAITEFDLAVDLPEISVREFSRDDIEMLVARFLSRATQYFSGKILLIADFALAEIINPLTEEKSNISVAVLPAKDRKIAPLLKENFGSRPLVLICDGGVWIDDALPNLLADHVSSGNAISVNSIQPGYIPIVFSAGGLGLIPDQTLNILAQCHELSGSHKQEVAIIIPRMKNIVAYLRLDEPEGAEFLFAAYRKDLQRNSLIAPPSNNVFWILNRRHLLIQLRRLDMFCGLRDKRVLELGCSVKHNTVINELLNRYGIKSYTGINIAKYEFASEAPNVTLIQEDIRKVNFQPGSFDLVFNFAFGEHVPEPQKIFKRVRDWLAWSGYHYGSFAIWSSAKGHHAFPPLYPADKIPDFGHLYLSPDEMLEHLKKRGVAEDIAAKTVQRIYRDPHINRVGIREYLDILETSGMDVVFLDGRANGRMHPLAKEVAPLTQNRYSPDELSFFGLEFLLRKSEVFYGKFRR